MPLKKSRKDEMIKDLENSVQKSESVVFVNFHGMTVSDETVLRRELRAEGIGYKVSRKTLLKRALAGKAEGEIPELGGEVAIAYSSAKALASAVSPDPTASARSIYNFQKTHKGILNILGGIFAGRFVDAAYMMEVATIPSKEVLLSKLAFLFKSPMQRLALAINEVSKKK